MMGYAWIHRVGIVTLVGVLVLSIGLACMADSAGAVPPSRSGSMPTQHWDGALPADQRVTVLAAFSNEAARDNKAGLVWEQSRVRWRP
ncbi:MAG: hypothetical protein ABI988_11135 [Nitrospirota bacterium]